MTFTARLREAVAFEDEVIVELRARGWTAEPFGQAQLSPGLRALLVDVPTPVRWMTDVVACRRLPDGAVECVFVDAKTGDAWRRSGNHDVETKAAMTGELWSTMSKCPVYFVFPDWGVMTPLQVIETCWAGKQPKPGSKGSGTPYVVFPRNCRPFDSVFGSKVHR